MNSPIRHQEPSPGAWAAAGACWWTREHWVDQVVPLVAGENSPILKRHGVAVETLIRWARCESAYAQDQRTGRGVVVRPSTLAPLMGCKGVRHVKRCRAAARELGLLVDVVPGRMLTAAEVAEARRAGSPQRGLSNVSALVVPDGYRKRVTPPQPVRHVTPTRGRGSQKKSSVKRNSSPLTNRSATAKGAAQAPPAPTKPVPPAFRLAVDLTRRVVWLQSTPPRRIAGQLKRFAEQPYPWSGADLIEEMDQIQRRLDYSTPHRPRVSAWALLKWYLVQINPLTGSYRQRRQRALRRPWCGRCDSPGHRWLQNPTGTWSPCPRCSPQATTAALHTVTPPPAGHPDTGASHRVRR